MLGKTCYPELGCFQAQRSRDLLNLAFNLLPFSPTFMSIKFHLFTDTNPKKSALLDYNSSVDKIKKSPFNPDKKTVIITHGFMDSYAEDNWNAVREKMRLVSVHLVSRQFI